MEVEVECEAKRTSQWIQSYHKCKNVFNGQWVTVDS